MAREDVFGLTPGCVSLWCSSSYKEKGENPTGEGKCARAHVIQCLVTWAGGRCVGATVERRSVGITQRIPTTPPDHAPKFGNGVKNNMQSSGFNNGYH